MSEWITEGVSTRVGFGHPNPVVHLMITSTNQLWCSGGAGRKATLAAGRGIGGGRPCPRCTARAREAFAKGDVDETEVVRFLPDHREPSGVSTVNQRAARPEVALR